MLQRRNEAERIDGAEARVMLFAIADIDRDVIESQRFQMQRDAHAVASRIAEECVELQRHRIMTSTSENRGHTEADGRGVNDDGACGAHFENGEAAFGAPVGQEAEDAIDTGKTIRMRQRLRCEAAFGGMG